MCVQSGGSTGTDKYGKEYNNVKVKESHINLSLSSSQQKYALGICFTVFTVNVFEHHTIGHPCAKNTFVITGTSFLFVKEVAM